jgi:guanine deaminase
MILVQGGQVLNAALDGLEFRDVLITKDTIKAVGRNLKHGGATVLKAAGMLVLPGLVNAHTHAHNNLTRGSGDNWTLEDLRNHGAALYANRTAEDHYLSAAVGAIEMLKTGCTAAYDQFAAVPAITEEGVEAVVRAYADSGMRAVLAPAATDGVFYRAVPGLIDLLPPDLRRQVEAIEGAPADALLKLKEGSIRRWNNHANGRIRIATAPTIPGECSDAYLQGCMKLAREYGVSLHTHLVETKIQALNAVRRWGKTMVRHLADVGVLGPGFIAGHGVWVTDEDIGLLAQAGAAVAHNPASNLKLGSGIAPVREMLERGIAVGLGSDGSMSSDNQDIFEAMRFAALVNKVRFPHAPERWIGAREVWAMATTGGARVLGLADDIGAIQPGRKADLILLRAASVFLKPTTNPLHALVYAETGASVETVMVAGKVVVEKGRLLTLDEGKIGARAQAAVDRLLVRNRDLKVLAQRLEPFVRSACRACAVDPFPVNRYAVPVAPAR